MENQSMTKTESQASTQKSQWNLARLTQAMRLLGGISLIGSATVYLLYGLQHLSSFWRFMAFELLLVVCGGLGVFCAKKLGESKGARTLLALGAAGFPVLLSQVGAMIFGLTQAVGKSPIPSFFSFSAGSWTEAAISLGSAAALMLPLVFTGFYSLDRKLGRQLSLGFVISSALLLIPIRQSFPVALMILAQVGLSGFFLWQEGRKGLRNMSHDRRYAQLLLMVPLAIMVGRSLFYPQSPFVVGAIFISLAGLTYALSHLSKKEQQVYPILQFCGVALTWIGWGSIVEGMDRAYHLSWEWETFLVVFPFFLILRLLHQAKVVTSERFLELAALFLPLIALFIGWDGSHSLVGQLTFICGGAIAIDGFRAKQRKIFHLGALTALVGITQTIFLAVEWLGGWSWLTLAIAGLVAIVLASLLESRAGKWKQHYTRYQAHWN